MINQQEILKGPFDIKVHKANFVNYLEIVIDKDGVCHYAVPSHNGILEKMILKNKGIEFTDYDFYEKISELCPREYWCDYREWLCKETGCIMVWGETTNVVIGEPNEKQLETLKELENNGLLYLGRERDYYGY